MSAGASPDPAFDPEGARWTPLSPRFVSASRLGVVVGYGIPTLALTVAAAVLAPWWVAVLVAALGVALGVWRWLRQPALWRARGYTERGQELWIRRGIWFRRFTVVPYGRMQVVDVTAGPIDRLFRLASVKLVTASAETDAQIPGLDPTEAARLRERLTLLGESQSAGL